MYDEAAKGVPLYPGSIGNVAVTAHGIGVRNKGIFVKSFIDSLIAVGLAEKLSNGEVKLRAEAAVDSSAPASPAAVLAARAVPGPPAQPMIRQLEQSPGVEEPGPVVNQVWQDGRVRVVLQVYSDAPLSATAFMQVGEVTTVIETLYDIVRSGD
jgi:hypothetical protein